MQLDCFCLEKYFQVPHLASENIFQDKNNQAAWRPEVYRSRQHDVTEPYFGWQVPKETSRKSNFTTTSSRPLETRNRFSVFELTGENIMEERKRNVVPGEHTYAEALSKASKNLLQNTNSRQSQQNRFYPESSRQNGNQQNNVLRSQNYGLGLAVRDQTRVRRELPEQRTYSKPTVTIIGDSMLRGVKRNDLSFAAPHIKSFVKTFGGATVDHMHSYMEPSLSMNPDGLILLCGTNNLRREQPDETANKIINLAVTAKRRVKNVAVSSIILRRDSPELDGKREEVNNLLERELRKLGIDFIKHDNIQERDLDRNGLHLNIKGSKLLTGNFVDFLYKA